MKPVVIPHSRPWITENDLRAVDSVLRGGMIAQGALVSEFEAAISEYLDIAGSVATASGTAALILALRALDIKLGSEVILPTYVCRSVLEAVLTVGAKPILCDVSEKWVMTPDNVEPHISEQTAAIIAVHIFGLAADIESMNAFGLPVIEDACQAFGLSINGKSAGSLGAVGVLSFQGTKCLTTGEGGMLTSDSDQLLLRAKVLRDGRESFSPRVPAPLSDLQAALGLSQLSRYGQFLERRQQLRDRYASALLTISALQQVDQNTNFLFRLPLRINLELSEVQRNLSDHGIHVRRGVDQLLHREVGLPDKNFPNAVRLYEETLSIPYYPALSNQDCDRVIESLTKFCQ